MLIHKPIKHTYIHSATCCRQLKLTPPDFNMLTYNICKYIHHNYDPYEHTVHFVARVKAAAQYTCSITHERL